MNEPTRPRRKTCKAVDEPGEAHFLTFSCYQRQPFLSGDRSRLWTVEAIGRAAAEHKFHLWAFVLMPEHVHLWICLIEREYSTSSFLRTLKKSVANRAVNFVKEHSPGFLARMAETQADGSVIHRFWQRSRGYDRNIRSPRYAWETIDYIHANPVRRELCDRPEDWNWSSAADHARVRAGHLPVDFASLPEDPRP